MPSVLKKLVGHIAFGFSVGGWVCGWITPFFYASCNFGFVHARVLKFYIWIPHGKITDMYFFFFSELYPFLELCPFK